MSFPQLHLNGIQAFGYRSERRLLKAVMEDVDRSLSFQPSTRKWSIGKRVIYLKGQERYSKWNALVLGIFHKIKYLMSGDYRRRYNEATWKITGALRSAFVASDRQIEKNARESLSFIGTHSTLQEERKREIEDLEEARLKSRKKVDQLKQKIQQKEGRLESFEQAIADVEGQNVSNEKFQNALQRLSLPTHLSSQVFKEGEIHRKLEMEKEILKKDLEGDKNKLKELEEYFQKDTELKEQTIKRREHTLSSMRNSPFGKSVSRFLSQDDISIPKESLPDPLAFDEEGPQVLSSASKLFLEKILNYVDEPSQKLWTVLLKRFSEHFKEDRLIEAREEGKSLHLQFKEPLRIWLPSTDDDGNPDPLEGIVMILGSNQYSSKEKNTSLKVDFRGGRMDFKGGLEIYAIIPDWATKLTLGGLSGIRIVSVCEYKREKDERYSLTATWWGFKKKRVKTMETIYQAWAEKGEILDRDVDLSAYLSSKKTKK